MERVKLALLRGDVTNIGARITISPAAAAAAEWLPRLSLCSSEGAGSAGQRGQGRLIVLCAGTGRAGGAGSAAPQSSRSTDWHMRGGTAQ